MFSTKIIQDFDRQDADDLMWHDTILVSTYINWFSQCEAIISHLDIGISNSSTISTKISPFMIEQSKKKFSASRHNEIEVYEVIV